MYIEWDARLVLAILDGTISSHVHIMGGGGDGGGGDGFKCSPKRYS